MVRTLITLTSPASSIVANTLPAYIGRVKLPSSPIPVTSLAMAPPAAAASRGAMSLPLVVAANTTNEASVASITEASVVAVTSGMLCAKAAFSTVTTLSAPRPAACSATAATSSERTARMVSPPFFAATLAAATATETALGMLP